MATTIGTLSAPSRAQKALRATTPGVTTAGSFDVLLRFETIIVACVLGLIAVAIPNSMADPDIWWHLRNANNMLAQHTFIRHDTFSFTARGSAWIDHEWLAELPFYLGWQAAGRTGVYLVTVGTIELIFAGVLFLCWRASGSWRTTSLATVVAALLSTVSFGPRTLLFGWLCLVMELIVLQHFPKRTSIVMALPPLFLVWVNLHGSWVIGLSILAVHTLLGFISLPGEWLDRPIMGPRHLRFLLFSWLGVLPALFCNPWGWRLVAYPFNLAFHQTLNIAHVQEWHSLDLHSARGRMVVALLLLLVGRQLYKPRSWSLVDLALLAIGLWSAFCYSRFLFLLALLVAPIAAGSFSKEPSPRVRYARHTANGLLLTVLLVLLGVVSLQKAKAADTAMEQFPEHAMPALASLEKDRRLFNEFLWGGYLEWYDRSRPVFIDSRIDIFEYNGTFKDYLDIVNIRGTQALLDRYQIEAVFFEKDTPLIYLLSQTGGWKTDFDDGKHVLLERKLPSFRVARAEDKLTFPDKTDQRRVASTGRDNL